MPGFFGKVAAHGDFVTRRLPPGFLGAWDRWLQRSLQTSREQLAHAWLDIYLTSPVWRFALAGGVCGQHAWAGILMPSVDRVGRHFPLTIASAMAGQGALPGCIGDGQSWYDHAERIALQTLDRNFTLDNFDSALTALPPFPAGARPTGMPAPAQPPAPRNCLIVSEREMPSFATAELEDALCKLGPSMTTLWWSAGSDRVAPCVLACEGLPAPNGFSALLDGRWARYGWRIHFPGRG